MDRTDRPLLALALVALVVLAFALHDLIVKELADRLPGIFIMAVRYAVNAVLLAALFLPAHGRAALRLHRPGPVALRFALVASASLAIPLALRVLPLAEATAIFYVAPIVTLVLAGRFLGERVGPAGWGAAALGFLGVLLIARPGAGLPPLGILCGLFVAAASGGYYLMSRVTARSESAVAVSLWTALAGTLLFVLLLPFGLPDMAAVTGRDWLLLVLLGLVAGIGHLVMTIAYGYAPASLLAPANYLQLVWAAALGLAFLGEWPTGSSAAGIVTILAAGGLILTRALRLDRRQAAPAERKE